MINIENLKLDIIESLKSLSLYLIILFGSYSYGNPSKDSDIDLCIVTDDEFITKTTF